MKTELVNPELAQLLADISSVHDRLTAMHGPLEIFLKGTDEGEHFQSSFADASNSLGDAEFSITSIISMYIIRRVNTQLN